MQHGGASAVVVDAVDEQGDHGHDDALAEMRLLAKGFAEVARLVDELPQENEYLVAERQDTLRPGEVRHAGVGVVVEEPDETVRDGVEVARGLVEVVDEVPRGVTCQRGGLGDENNGEDEQEMKEKKKSGDSASTTGSTVTAVSVPSS